ncbi:ubiquitin family protein [Fusarium austroafricanum]|uniref:Ubiquitin family protein n=1 Tax=Fusarium austroafricanum TaxID=2364996 RepID=A0A8H4K473_9HYPO|nr:ubiquitin family protein [Fusarium austroafricanum]
MKKLPFKPTALRRAAPKPTQPEDSKDSDDDGLSLFRRAKEMAPIMAADQERRWKRHREAGQEAERKRLEAAREKRPRDNSEDSKDADIASQDTDAKADKGHPSLPLRADGTPVTDQSSQDGTGRTSELVTPPPSKRSRLDSSSAQRPILSPQLDIDQDPFPDASPTRRLRKPSTPSRKPKTEGPKSGSKPTTDPITIDSDSESDSAATQARPTLPPKQRSSSIELAKDPAPPPAEEDEFAEYIRKAEEKRARQQALQNAKSEEQTKESINILVLSSIPHAFPLEVKYQFSKPLRRVRDVWVDYQRKKGVPSIEHDDVVLTWRRQRIYNTSSLIGLGIRPTGDGRAEAEDGGSSGFRQNRTSIEIEAWNSEQFQEMEHKQELQRKRDAGELSEEEEEKPEERIRFVIVLKARDLEPLKSKVLPETTVETLILYFRQQRQIGSDREISLWWDGDRLEEHVEMQEAEIEADDTIEVHIS